MSNPVWLLVAGLAGLVAFAVLCGLYLLSERWTQRDRRWRDHPVASRRELRQARRAYRRGEW